MEIKFSSLTYIEKGKKVLDNLNLKFEESKIYAVLGKSDSGKEMLGYLISGLILPTSGKIEINPFTLTPDKRIKNVNKLRSQIGFVLARPEEQFFSETVKKEIALGMENFKYRLKEKNKHISDALKVVGLDDKYLKRDSFTLSLGEQKLVALASILAYNPKIIILDDPTYGLDYFRKKELIKLIKMLKRKYKKLIIIISSDVEFINEVSDYNYVLDKGSLAMEGTNEKVFMNSKYQKMGLELPKITQFQKMAKDTKKVKMIYRNQINDLIKEIYRAK